MTTAGTSARTDLAIELGVLETKVAPPRLGTSLVARPALIDRLVASTVPMVGIVAPAGYGKSTLLGQWSTSDPRPFAWLTVDQRDDAASLARGVAAAMATAIRLDDTLAEALRHPGPSIWSAAMPRLGRAIADAPPFVLALDDVDRLSDPEVIAVVLAVAGSIRTGSRLALAARTEHRLPVARLVAGGQLDLIERDELAFDIGQTGAALEALGVHADPEAVRALHERTEGWPAAVSLLARHRRTTGSAFGITASPSDPATRDQLLERYVRDEILPADDGDAAFLLRTSVLDHLTPSLCDAVLDRRDSAEVLDRLERSTPLLVPIGPDGRWFRYHRLIAELLRAELARREPEQASVVLARAGAWHEAAGMPELAIDDAMAAGDADRVARLAPEVGQDVANSGRLETVRRWFDWLDANSSGPATERASVFAALLFATAGEGDTAARWLARAGAPDRVADPDLTGLAALARALLAREGEERLLEDAEEAAALVPAAFRPTGTIIHGVALSLVGGTGEAEARIEEGLAAWAGRGPGHIAAAVGLAWLAGLALDRGDRPRADELVRRARSVARAQGLGDQLPGVLADAAAARLAQLHGATTQARADAAHAELHRHVTDAMPWLATRARLDLIRVHLGLGDPGPARVLLAEIRDMAGRHGLPAGQLAEVEEVERRVRDLRAVADGATLLTAAELRVLPLLSTHLSFREIGERLYVSQNTVKTQALSIYRKLDASSRSEAVARAVELGLLAGGPQ